MEFPGLLLVISGPSGVGKGTLCKALVACHNNLHYSVSVTTREPRLGEEEGKDYSFINREEFLRRIAGNEFLEWAEVYGNLYGTPWTEVERSLEQGNDIMLEIDTQGALKVKKKLADAVLVFIVPPSRTELETRIINRGKDCPDAVKKRLDSVEKELAFIDEYDYVVENDNFSEALERLKCIYSAEKCRAHRAVRLWKG